MPEHTVMYGAIVKLHRIMVNRLKARDGSDREF